MASGTYAHIRILIPLIPGLLLTALLYALRRLPTRGKWDFRTTMHVAVLRGLTTRGPSPIGKTQAFTTRDPGAKGRLWVVPVRISASAPENDQVRDVVCEAIESLGNGFETYTRPQSADINAEWTGFRDGVKDDAPLPADMSTEQRYEALMREPCRTTQTTILYFHGGAYYLAGLASHRTHVSKLARACSGRALNVEYRLAPQAAFPTQLVDALNAYLYLLYPPPGSLHQAVQAKHIVFAGDSAGGNLVFALGQLLLQMYRDKPEASKYPQMQYQGRTVDVPLPAGMSACSGWFDIARAMPSIDRNAAFDYLPAATHDDVISRIPADDIWPADPPRGDLFCDLSLLCHPLCSPIAAEDWRGAPPVWLSTGQEMLSDEDAFVAELARQQKVPVQFEIHEAMPHCAMIFIPTSPPSAAGYKSWGEFCANCVRGEAIESRAKVVHVDGRESQLEGPMCEMQREEVSRLMQQAKQRRLNGWEREAKLLPKPGL